MHILGHLTVEEFLRDYWQQKPVLIRNAWPDFEPLLSSSELAGLSLEEEIESRLVEEEGKDGPWAIRTGPFTEDDYRALPERKWTLLIQAVDHWIPEAADILEHFRFLPSWRIDDLMISYAVDGGSVGPHYDQYDVFLLQAEGQREWRIGQMCSDDSPILKGPKIRVLQQFDETERWTLNPGDMLYLPPQLAHYGIAQGECMTYSIGFRAPSQAELAQAAMDDILASASEDQRYTDAGIRPTQTPGLIDQDAIARLRALLTAALNDDERLQQVLGKLMTEAKYPEQLPEPRDEASWDELHDELNHYQQWRRSEFARFAYSQQDNQCSFFALGHSWSLPAGDLALVAYLADNSQYETEVLQTLAASTTAQSLLTSLWQRHMLYSPETEFGD
ncbi:cupin domain-containing protein [Thalassolituus sp. ST750PaO-4]|uniref:cupin domain-containing protein n=1 Tax=Thalassolituus sp. ST750PaO-4 TaxID=2742965 RepID=UPI001CE3AFD5|nr:cupin domain-containing protein [Thalassolituus sp. ST750PaO-4]MCA6060879.1 cupin domain-containing protein [Thalassolituus sp. ST750PaO-4]